MTEKQIEQKLVMEVKAHGGICPKLVCPGMVGMPDRLILLSDGKVGFVEVKSPGQKPRKIQLKRHEQLRELGYQVFVLDHPDKIAGIIDEIQSGGKTHEVHTT